MKGKTLSGLLVILGIALGAILIGPDRSVSKLMESCGEFISNALGL